MMSLSTQPSSHGFTPEQLKPLMAAHAQLVANFLNQHFARERGLAPGHERLVESIRYSLLQDGGKRFRPVLSLLVAQALEVPIEKALPFGAAVECVHTYSLIHDDLPAMDNDDFRRGQPTNHKAFDEATAILAGDALLTEAFQIVAQHYSATPSAAVRLVAELAKAAGYVGMVGGQAVDMNSKKEKISAQDLQTMHELKTGALIRVSALGAAIATGATEDQCRELSEYARHLGLAFQVADDILDYEPSKIEPGSYPAVLGPQGAVDFLDRLTENCLSAIAHWPEAAEPLRALVRYNRTRRM